jgi:hypothetical protein
MASDSLFRSKAPGIMNLLMADFALDLESAAAILGNLGHESEGFRAFQERKPLIPGSRGGFGWAMWTADRRVGFENYVRRNGFDPLSDNANYKWLFYELKYTRERAAIPAVKNALGLEGKVRAFELAFERASDEHKGYPSRNKWALVALDAYQDNPGGTIEVEDTGEPDAAQQPGNTGVATLPDAPAGNPLGNGFMDFVRARKEDARRFALSGVVAFNTVYPDDPIVIQGAAKPPAEPTGTPPSVKASAGAFAIGAFLQMLGVVPPPEVVGPILGAAQPPTTAGTLTTFLPILAGIVGKFGGFSPLAGIGSSILDMIVKRRTAKP